MTGRGRRWLLLGAPLLAAVVLWGWWSGSTRVHEARRELAGLEARREQLDSTRRTLALEVEALHTDREARKRAARETLDVAAPGEFLVIVAQPTPVGRPVTGIDEGIEHEPALPTPSPSPAPERAGGG
jgi:cell division protein FtsB